MTPDGRARLADTAATIINMSRTGVLLGATQEWLPGSQLPLTIDLAAGSLETSATVVRSEITRVYDGSIRRQFAMALVFGSLSPDAEGLLDLLFGHQPGGYGIRIGRIFFSRVRYCPRCHSRSVGRDSRHHYSCDDCRHQFVGYRIGSLRIAV
jgi:hypothetical protein